MGIYADQIEKLKLYKRLKEYLYEGTDFSSSDITTLESMVVGVADSIGDLLKRIPETFKQYTEHDIRHCCNVIDLMGRFIPTDTLQQLNPLELTILILTALLHDTGMIVSDQEKESFLGLEEFKDFKVRNQEQLRAIEEAISKGNNFRARAIEDALLAEYLRRFHNERVADFMEKYKPAELKFREAEISTTIARICESHTWQVFGSFNQQCVAKLDPKKKFGSILVNEQFIACCIRLGDILDFDRSRTPVAVFEYIEFTEDKSWEEWNKHLSINGWEITESNISFDAECTHPVFYVAVIDFIDFIDRELEETHYLLSEASRKVSDHYELKLPRSVDRREIGMKDKSMIAGGFRFSLEYENIMQLLMDKSLYPDPSLFLRELLQNSLDACRRKEAEAEYAGQKNQYEPKICVWDHSKDTDKPRIIFQDNGIGMSRHIVENYFLRVGKSYYRSSEFDAERAKLAKNNIELDTCSYFGIGILSCFLVADHFEIETYQYNNEPLNITVEGPTKYFIIKRLRKPEHPQFQPNPENDFEDGPPDRTGTRVTVYLQSGVNIDAYEVLENFAVNVDYNIKVYYDDGSTKVINKNAWEEKRILFNDQCIILSYNPSEDKRIHDNINKVISASEISFSGGEFSSHIRGKAWFWLFVDAKEKMCPQVGYLEINSGIALYLHEELFLLNGPPLFLEYIQQRKHEFSDDFIRQDFLPLLNESLESVTFNQDVLDRFRDKYSKQGGLPNMIQSLLEPIWASMDPDERYFVIECIRSGGWSGNKDKWFKRADIIKCLIRKENTWSDKVPDFTITVPGPKLYFFPFQKIALHSILIPSGIAEWNPKEMKLSEIGITYKEETDLGSYYQSSILGGAYLDIRGTDSPTPSVNRWFIPYSNAEKVITTYWRAVLRHAVNLIEDHGEKSKWNRWFYNLCVFIFQQPEGKKAIETEWGTIVKYIALVVQLEKRKMYLNKDELLGHFAQEVPVAHSSDDGILIDFYYSFNEYILEHHPDMEYRDGKVYIKPAFNTRENPNSDY